MEHTACLGHSRGVRGLIPVVALALLALGGSTAARAARTRHFLTDSYGEFRRTDISGVCLSDDGRVFPAPQAEKVADPEVRTVWGLARDGKGNVILATGDQGKVFRVSSGKAEGEPKVLADLLDYELFALAANEKGELFVSGAPTGTVARISPDGTVKSLFRVPEQAVFGLLAGPDGTVYAAAGEHGRLYQISSSGEGKVLCESADLSVRCLAWRLDHEIWAGTSGRGLVERISPSTGKLRVVYDAAEEEIVGILPLADGSIVFGANPGTPAGGSAAVAGGAAAAGQSPDGAAPPPGGSPSDHDGGGSGEGPHPVLYRMNPNGSVRPFWKCPEKTIHCLALDGDGSILVGTGDDAAIYRVKDDGSETVLWAPEEQQVLSVLPAGGAIYAGTGGPGRLYRLGPGPSTEGKMTSEVLDAKDQAAWGHIRVEGTVGMGGLSFETRSGFSKDPDASWSDWTAAREDQDGLSVQSPAARFLQWRVTMKPGASGGPELRQVEVSYAGANTAPRISSLRLSPDEPAYTANEPGHGGITQVLPGGVQIDYSIAMGSNPIVAVEEVPTWIRRIRSILWEAQDPDGDELEYTLEIRPQGEEKFRTLASKVRDRAFSVDSGMLPDGSYEIRLTASDAPSNPAGTELTATKLSPPFHVDTVPPVLHELKARKLDAQTVLVTGTAEDESSPLRRIEGAVDGGSFYALTPKDGILDTRIEPFEGKIPLEKEQTGNWIVVRAQDEAGNRSSYRAWLEP